MLHNGTKVVNDVHLSSTRNETSFEDHKKYKSEIENSFVLSRLTNDSIEGINNHIKVIKRVAYGYNNFKHFRPRILLSLKNNVIFFSD